VPSLYSAGLRVHRVGAGEPLVLLHGLGSASYAWGPVLGALAARHTVVACDLPGFGSSPALPAGVPPTPEALADAVERMLDELELDSPHLSGNSLGGWVALELARRGRARSLVLISPAGFWSDGERRYARASLRLAHRQARLLAPVAPGAMAVAPLRFAFFAQIRRRPRRLVRREAANEVRTTAGRQFGMIREVTLDGRRAERLQEIDCPTLVLWGTRDLLLPVRQARRAVEAIPGGAFRALPGLGHVPMSDDPEQVSAEILEFVASAAPTPASA
jgi:pimeloyl-ACP methyl ester carboxylesterase